MSTQSRFKFLPKQAVSQPISPIKKIRSIKLGGENTVPRRKSPSPIFPCKVTDIPQHVKQQLDDSLYAAIKDVQKVYYMPS